MDQANQLTVQFLMPARDGAGPAAADPRRSGLPDWFKALPQHGFSSILEHGNDDRQKYPPFIDAMTFGFLMPLTADLKVENGEFSWVSSNIPVARKLRNTYAFSDRLPR